MHPNTKILTGRKFGRLTVLRPTQERTKRSVIWLCQCECGEMPRVSGCRLLDGSTKSCGCLQREGSRERMLKRNQEHRGRAHPSWRGGRNVDKEGYILIHNPDHPRAFGRGYVFEHRLVMEQRMGRYLRPEEVVHHIDGNHQNNNPENLHVFQTNTAHLRWHRRLAEIALYD